jgi:hypothetical protein
MDMNSECFRPLLEAQVGNASRVGAAGGGHHVIDTSEPAFCEVYQILARGGIGRVSRQHLDFGKRS